MDYKVHQGLQSILRWITKCNEITNCDHTHARDCPCSSLVNKTIWDSMMLTITDLLSKSTQAYPLPETQATFVAMVLINQPNS